jgi:hypothetical protein
MEFPKQMSEGRIEGQSLPEERQGLPEAVRRGNRMQGLFWPAKPVAGPEK